MKTQIPPSKEEVNRRSKPTPMRNFDDTERRKIIAELLKRSTNGDLTREELAALADRLGRHMSTKDRIWAKYKQAASEGTKHEGWRSSKKQRVGRMKVNPTNTRKDLQEHVAAVPGEYRQVQRRIVDLASISRYLVRALIKEEELIRASGRKTSPIFEKLV